MRTTIQQTLAIAKQQLRAVTDSPILDAEILLAHILKRQRSYLYASPQNELSEQQATQFLSYLQRRLAREPIAYITGHKEFWSLDLAVSVDTLIPRPETELLVETVLQLSNAHDVCVADLGTGSGAIALALSHERPTWKIHATDINQNALTIAQQNAVRFGLKNISFSFGDWCAALPKQSFDVIVSNPPYIADYEWEAYADGLMFEPKTALLSGADGLDAIREISQTAIEYLSAKGYLLVEHGFLQGAAVRDIYTAFGYTEVQTLRDLANRERATIGRYGR